MILYTDNPVFNKEITELLRVFYPGEAVSLGPKEQSSYRLITDGAFMTVAYFVAGKEVGQITEEKTANERLQARQLTYDLCGQITGKKIRWGILTGIRPTKLTFKLLGEGQGMAATIKRLKEVYRLSDEKARLLADVVRAEAPFIEPRHQGHSVYIGIPFCPSKCSYCTFPSYRADKWPEVYEAYVSALLRELEAGKAWLSDCESLYIGGGTPTSLTEEDFEKVLRKVRAYLGHRTVEFTVEAGRPDTITEGKLAVMKACGVTRISINPQTMCDATLSAIGRSHDSLAVARCFEMARGMGFDHINMDLILGLPGEGIDHVAHTLKQVHALNPESITVHTLAYKKGSKLSAHLSPEVLAKAMDDTLKLVEERMAAQGYKPYYLYRQKQMVGNFENVGYCKPGKQSLYNILIMEEVSDIIAFGAGVISKRIREGKIKRLDQPKNLTTYLENLDKIIEKKANFFGQQNR